MRVLKITYLSSPNISLKIRDLCKALQQLIRVRLTGTWRETGYRMSNDNTLESISKRSNVQVRIAVFGVGIGIIYFIQRRMLKFEQEQS